jgi:hypothetical protein
VVHRALLNRAGARPGHARHPQGELVIKQTFQNITGTLRAEGRTVPIEGKVRGEEVTFTAGGRHYKGKMNGKRLELSS